MFELYGLPQRRNADGRHGSTRYVEAHLWCDEPILQVSMQVPESALY